MAMLIMEVPQESHGLKVMKNNIRQCLVPSVTMLERMFVDKTYNIWAETFSLPLVSKTVGDIQW